MKSQILKVCNYIKGMVYHKPFLVRKKKMTLIWRMCQSQNSNIKSLYLQTGRSQTSNLKTFLTWTNLQEFHLCSKLISKVNHQKSVSELHNIIYYFIRLVRLANLKLQIKQKKSEYRLKQTSHYRNSNLKKCIYINKTFMHFI